MTLPEELPAFISSFRELFSDPMNKVVIVNGQKKKPCLGFRSSCQRSKVGCSKSEVELGLRTPVAACSPFSSSFVRIGCCTLGITD